MATRLTDAAWRAIIRATDGPVQGRVLYMSRGTMMAIRSDRGQDWHPQYEYRLYGVSVRYDDRMPFGHITLEKRKDW